jgi:GT2 family glycosyltransferase
MYADETDFCWRARLAGIRLAAIPSARMWHKVSLYMNRRAPTKRYYVIRSQIWYYRRFSKGLQVPIMVGFTILRMLRLGWGDLFHRDLGNIPAMLRGWWDGWFGPMKQPAIPFCHPA